MERRADHVGEAQAFAPGDRSGPVNETFERDYVPRFADQALYRMIKMDMEIYLYD